MEFNPKELLAQAQRASQEIQEKMRATSVEASAGGGTVSVTMNGQKQLLSVKIDPEAVKSGDVEMLQDLITAAVNEASRKVDTTVQSTLGGMLGDMNLPF
ncbi:MAG TPA: YbaB/EbfC family nucleoid-associated protein [Terriglobales bacterium]|jgi:DNA-binding YbaB/EbfC family protein|nr:YbaB/EbfC family nucleoid-associated protein [Terriglobales bacterium]